MIDDEIVSFALSHGEGPSMAVPEPTPDEAVWLSSLRNARTLPSVLPLLDHLSKLHPEVAPDELVGQVDAALDRLYRAGRVSYAGHRWLSEPPATVAGTLTARLPELRFGATTRTWSWTGTAWTANITVI